MFKDFAKLGPFAADAADLRRDALLASQVAACARLDWGPHGDVAFSCDNRPFVHCSINGLELLNLGRLSGILVKAPRHREAASP